MDIGLASGSEPKTHPRSLPGALHNADMAVTERRCDRPSSEMSGSIQQEDAFLVALRFRDVPNRE
jgi:hypothetical protein